MKIKQYILPVVASIAIAFGTQSCFQDMNRPDFNYPEGEPDPTGEYNPLKVFLPFEGNLLDKSTYQFIPTGRGISFVDGVNGKAYNSTNDSTFMVLNAHPAIEKMVNDTLSNLGSFTVAFWMNSKKNNGATGVFGIANKQEFWGNIDIFLENNDSETEAFFKVHMFNVKNGVQSDGWVEAKIPNVFQKWTHMAFKYDGATSTFTIYKDGVVAFTRVIDNFGPLKFKNVGPMVIGTLQFQTIPSSTTNTGNQDWAKWYQGSLDQFRFYNKSLTNSEINQLFTSKE